MDSPTLRHVRPPARIITVLVVLACGAGCGGGTTTADVERVVRDQLMDAQLPPGFEISKDGTSIASVEVDGEPTTRFTDVGDTIACRGRVSYDDGSEIAVPVDADLRSDGIWAQVTVDLR